MNEKKSRASPKVVIALSTIITLLVWTSILTAWKMPAEAATLTSMSDTLSDSDTGVSANHTIKFTTPTGVSAGQTISYTFGTATTTTGFASTSIAALGLEDFDFTIAGIEQAVTSTASCSGAQWVRVTTSTSVSTSSITVEICTSNSIAASATTTLEIGTNATASSTGNSQVTNPSTAGSYEITIGGTQTDSGALRVAIIDDVTVTAAVATSFTFTISGIDAGTSCAGVTTSATSTATTMPFGTLSTSASSTICQTLAVTTNAASGFTVTVQADQALTSANGADIDYFDDGAQTSTPTSWSSPAGTLGSEATYGHWGITTEDSNLSTDTGSSTDAFVSGSNYQYVGNFSSARRIFAHTGPADGLTANQGSTKIAVSVQVSTLQEAASDYTATLTYIATPTF